MSLLEHIDKSLIENLMNSNEFKGWLLSRRWFGDKFILSNMDFQVILDYFNIIKERIFLSIIKIKKADYEKKYFLPLIYYKNLNFILKSSEKNKSNILKLTENTFSKKIALTIKKDQKIFTVNLVEAEYCLYFWDHILFEKEISEKFPELSLKLRLYTEQFQDELNMKKVQSLIEATIYSDRYEAKLEQLGKGNTTNLLFKLTLKNLRENQPEYSYVLKSYKEFSESIEPIRLFILVKNDFPNAPKIYGTIEIENKESIGIIEYVDNAGNIGEIYWNELNDMINSIFDNMNKDFSEYENKSQISKVVKDYCPKTFKVSEVIGRAIKGLHGALIYSEMEDFKSEIVETEHYLDNYTYKLNSMTTDLQNLMQKESSNMFYNLPKISSVFLDTKDIIEKFRYDFTKDKIEIQPVHEDLHMEQILYNESNDLFNFYFMDFEGDPELEIEDKRKKFPIEKDLASFLRSLSYIKFNTLLLFIERNIIEKDSYTVPEEILYSLYFRRGSREKRKNVDLVLKFLDQWETKLMNKILKELNPNITLINYFSIDRILHEIKYEMLFRPNKFIVPLLGLKEIIEKNS